MAFKLVIFLILTLLIIRIAPLAAAPVDTYYHLAVGREVYEQRKIPTEDNFIYSDRAKKFVSTEWLSGLIFYITVKFLGFNALYLLRAVVVMLAAYFLYKTFSLLKFGSLTVIMLTTIVTVVLAGRSNDRPEIFSFLILSIINYVFFKYYLQKKLSRLVFAIPIIFAVWPNIHAFFTFGIISLVFFTLIILFQSRFNKIKYPRYNHVLIIFLSSIAFSLAQFDKFGYFTITQKYQLIIGEWISFLDFFHRAGINLFVQIPTVVYLVSIFVNFAAAILILITLKKHPKSLIYLFFTAFSLIILLLPVKFIRLIQVALLITSPISLFVIIKVFPKKFFVYGRAFLIIIFCWSIIFAGMTIINNKAWVINLKNPPFLGKQNQETPKIIYWREDFPSKAADIINTYLETKRLYSSNYWNSYFIWASPQVKVFSDVIFENLDAQSIQEDLALIAGKNNWEELLKKYNIDTVINSGSDAHFSGANLTPVFKLPEWKLVFVDNLSSVYARNDVIKSIPVNLSAIHPELISDIKFKEDDEDQAIKQLEALLKFDHTNDFARTQLILFYRVKDLEEARVLAEESRQLLPKNPWFSYLLYSILVRQGDCESSEKYANEAIEKSLNDFHVKDLIQETREECAPIT